jgi:hypothetical protein
MSTKLIAACPIRQLVVRNLRAAGFVAAVMFLITGQIAWGSVTGSISGVVRDTSGAIIPAAQVVALNTQTGMRWTVTTDA